MFAKNLNDLKLYGSIADKLFPNVTGSSFHEDQSFVATLRVLCSKRLKGDERLRLSVSSYSKKRKPDDMDDLGHLKASVFNEAETTEKSDRLLLISVDDRSEDIGESFDFIDKAFRESFPNYKELKDLSAFLNKQSEGTIATRFFVNESKRDTCVFIQNISIRDYHLVQAFIPRLLPWLFADNPLDEKEKDLCRSLSKKTSTDYERIINSFADGVDFRNARISAILDGFENKAKRFEMSNLKAEIDRNSRDIAENLESYRRLVESWRRNNQLLDGLKYQIASEKQENEMSKFFMETPCLNVVDADNYGMSFIVSNTLDTFDPAAYESISGNLHSYMFEDYEVSGFFEDKKKRKKLLDAIFRDEIFKVKLCGFYHIDISRADVTSSSGYHYPIEYKDRLPNPHLQNHNCLGDYRPRMREAVRTGDYIGAVGWCMASSKAINIAESASFRPFLRELFKRNCAAVIQMPDGSSKTPEEAFNWLLDQEKAVVVETKEGEETHAETH